MNQKEGLCRKEKKRSDLPVLLGCAGSNQKLTSLGLDLSAVALVPGTLPYICIWLTAREKNPSVPRRRGFRSPPVSGRPWRTSGSPARQPGGPLPGGAQGED